MKDANAAMTRLLSCGFDSLVGTALHRKSRGFESRSEPEIFSGHFSSSAMAAFVSQCHHIYIY